MPDDNKIRRIVQEELQKNQLRSAFKLQTIPLHRHDGVDSPNVFSPTITYTGFIPSDADLTGATTSGFVFVPQGWSATVNATVYEITHNLNTDYYTVNCSLYGPEAPNALTPNIICLPNSFQVVWNDNLLISYEADFSFQLVQINNKARSFPVYNAKGGTL